MNHRINFYYKSGDGVRLHRYPAENNVLPCRVALPNGVNEPPINSNAVGLVISDVRTEESAQEPDSTGEEVAAAAAAALRAIAHNSSACSNGDAFGDLLEPMFQTSENVHETESGGTIEVASGRKQQAPIAYQCDYCKKIYRKANAWRKHVRSHQMSNAGSAVGRLAAQRAPPNNGRAAVIEPIAGPSRQPMENNVAVVNVPGQPEPEGGWRNHVMALEKRYDCEHCGRHFFLLNEYDWHTATCEARKMADESIVQSMRKRRRTRTPAPDKSAPIGPMFTASPKKRNSKKHNQTKAENWGGRSNTYPSGSEITDGETDDDSISLASGFTSVSRMSRMSMRSALSMISTDTDGSLSSMSSKFSKGYITYLLMQTTTTTTVLLFSIYKIFTIINTIRLCRTSIDLTMRDHDKNRRKIHRKGMFVISACTKYQSQIMMPVRYCVDTPHSWPLAYIKIMSLVCLMAGMWRIEWHA